MDLGAAGSTDSGAAPLVAEGWVRAGEERAEEVLVGLAGAPPVEEVGRDLHFTTAVRFSDDPLVAAADLPSSVVGRGWWVALAEPRLI